ncbi:uncharacterized Golgi apparatus membrane protein-like protein CG5021 isoform X1 [Pollicipes pollicipes]|uniref:uncharacterized Golgi apparatus membrane protein-like protein CG5021 isoform X2 n=1 Tax=Pollicipes pollicipes TaxID=41117 RepID=UPI001885454B|nr:uncharacterized Golgi apparatus membrane protein-like protein CG5021 isoform X2 [Pollicipes pollicipes]XP_037094483.1 uncharacterized Golgi apparatus membrane protein-like protein CG5021 isoform X1 [Pollicipes pollicipes]
MASNAPLLDDDDTPAFGEENEDHGKLKHPFVTLFHLLFRFGAIIVYILANWLGQGFISCFIIIILLLSADFWTVKNITGRLMVGLRWWNYVDDDGTSHWVYESRKGLQQSRVHAAEARIFWAALYASPVLWVILLIFAFFSFTYAWMVLPAIGIVLNGANVYGYLRCRYGSSQGIQTSLGAATTSFMRDQVMKNISSMMFRQPAASGTSQPQQTV